MDKTIEIPLSKGKKSIIDIEDYPLISQYRWFTHKSKNNYYAVTRITKTKKQERMHRLILGAKPNEQVDHLNHNGLDNRRCNIRIVTQSQNNMNQRKTRGISKYKGVYWHKPCNKWASTIKINNKRIHLGSFINEEDAARAYDNKAKELFGEYACFNFNDGLEKVFPEVKRKKRVLPTTKGRLIA